MSEPLQAIGVRVENFEEFSPVFRTEEVEAGHFTCSTFTLPQGEIIGAGVQATEPTQILQLDPLRKRAVVSFNGTGQIVLAHSVQQATSLAANVQQAADEGALFTCPGSITVESTAPLWAVAISNSQAALNSAFAYGKATGPAAFTAIVTIPAGSLPAGQWSFTVTTFLDGTITAADEDNFRILVNGAVLAANIIQPGPTAAGVQAQAMTTGPFTVTMTGAGAISVQSANNAGGIACVYHAEIVATPLSLAGNAGAAAVGVVQERRDQS